MVRLMIEHKHSTNSFFITLTYDEKWLNYEYIDSSHVACLRKRDLQLFLKRLRAAIAPDKIRFYACGEYGLKSLRPHYHLIVFNWPKCQDIYEMVRTRWPKGFVSVKAVKPSHFRYVAKYCSSYSELPDIYRSKKMRPFATMSLRPAIGSQYLTDQMVSYHRESLSILYRNAGNMFALPKYYKDKIFDDDMKAVIRERVDLHREKVRQDGERKMVESGRTGVIERINDHFLSQEDWDRRKKLEIYKSEKL